MASPRNRPQIRVRGRGQPRPVSVLDTIRTAVRDGGSDPEQALYSNVTVDRVTGHRTTTEARTAASQRMKARALATRTLRRLSPPTDDDLDELGEAAPEPVLDGSDDDEIVLTPTGEAEVERRAQERLAVLIASAQAAQATPLGAAALQQPQAQEVPAPGITAHALTIEDADRLWDWVRADADGGAAFFGRPLANSHQLHQYLSVLVSAEESGAGLLRAIYYDEPGCAPTHLGFAALAPILSTERVAVMHIYLAPVYRGQLARLTAPLVELAAQLLPSYQLAVFSADATAARLHRQVLAPLGFREQVVFVR